VLAAQVRHWREARRLSAEALAERVSKLGWPISRTTVTKIELEQRGVYVEEAFIIAAALNVPPPVLFFGLESGEHVTLTEKSTIHPDLARKWLCGEGPLADTSRAAIGTEDWYGAAGEWESAHGSVRLYELLNEAQEAVHAAWRSRTQANRGWTKRRTCWRSASLNCGRFSLICAASGSHRHKCRRSGGRKLERLD
jgi:transcriptional regulator with XRE-family HTH domain